MALPALVPCPGCARHLRVTESTCPFCQAALAGSLAAAPRARNVIAGLSRAALYALGTGALSLSPACSSSTGPRGPTGDMTDDASSSFTDAYGGPREDGGMEEDTGRTTIQPLYGAPVMTNPPDADDASSPSEDASDSSLPSIVPLYGAPYMPPGTEPGPTDAGDAADGGAPTEARDASVDAGHVTIIALYGAAPFHPG